jgi:nickel transport protein
MQPVNKQPLRKKALIAIFVAFILTVSLLATRVLAHKVNVFAWVEGDMVFVEGYFPGGKRAQNSLVEVFNKAGAKVLEGKTNEKGEFSFKVPEKGALKIVLTAGMEHKNDFIVPASDFGVEATAVSGSPPELPRDKTDPTTVTTDARQLEEMIDKALDRKLAPVMRLIRKTRREGPTVTEIIGGIGYIFGLLGVAAYFSNRRKKERGRSEVKGQQNTDRQ